MYIPRIAGAVFLALSLIVLAGIFVTGVALGAETPAQTNISIGENNPNCVIPKSTYTCDWSKRINTLGAQLQCLRNRPCEYKKGSVLVKGTCQLVQGKPECSEICFKNLAGECQAINTGGKVPPTTGDQQSSGQQSAGKLPELPKLPTGEQKPQETTALPQQPCGLSDMGCAPAPEAAKVPTEVAATPPPPPPPEQKNILQRAWDGLFGAKQDVSTLSPDTASLTDGPTNPNTGVYGPSSDNTFAANGVDPLGSPFAETGTQADLERNYLSSAALETPPENNVVPQTAETQPTFWERVKSALIGPPIEEIIANDPRAQQWAGVTPESIEAANNQPPFLERYVAGGSEQQQQQANNTVPTPNGVDPLGSPFTETPSPTTGAVAQNIEAPQGNEARVIVSGYVPCAGGINGGCLDAQSAPVRTLDDVQRFRDTNGSEGSPTVTLASRDRNDFGKEFNMGTVKWVGADGEVKSMDNVIGKVTDLCPGCARGQYDVAVVNSQQLPNGVNPVNHVNTQAGQEYFWKSAQSWQDLGKGSVGTEYAQAVAQTPSPQTISVANIPPETSAQAPTAQPQSYAWYDPRGWFAPDPSINGLSVTGEGTSPIAQQSLNIAPPTPTGIDPLGSPFTEVDPAVATRNAFDQYARNLPEAQILGPAYDFNPPADNTPTPQAATAQPQSYAWYDPRGWGVFSPDPSIAGLSVGGGPLSTIDGVPAPNVSEVTYPPAPEPVNNAAPVPTGVDELNSPFTEKATPQNLPMQVPIMANAQNLSQAWGTGLPPWQERAPLYDHLAKQGLVPAGRYTGTAAQNIAMQNALNYQQANPAGIPTASAPLVVQPSTELPSYRGFEVSSQLNPSLMTNAERQAEMRSITQQLGPEPTVTPESGALAKRYEDLSKAEKGAPVVPQNVQPVQMTVAALPPQPTSPSGALDQLYATRNNPQAFEQAKANALQHARAIAQRNPYSLYAQAAPGYIAGLAPSGVTLEGIRMVKSYLANMR